MRSTLALTLLASPLLAAAAGCGTSTANPISTGGSATTSSAGTTSHASTGTGGHAGATGTGGTPPSSCSPACASGEVCVESTCHAIVALDTGSTGTAGCTIALDATTVYWATNQVRHVPKAGGPATGLGAWVATPALAVDSSYLYFSGNSGISRGPKAGAGGFSSFAGAGFGSPTHIASDGSALYYIEVPSMAAAGVFTTPTTGTPVDPSATPAVFATGIYGIGTLAVDAASVYFWGAQGLVRQDKATQATTLLAAQGMGFELNINTGAGIVVDGTTVYYSTSPAVGSGGVIAGVSGAGGASTVVVDAQKGTTGVFTVDATSLYYMTFDGVMKAPKAGGAAVSLSGLNPPSPFPTCMAADDTYVYWVDGATLMQYKK